MGYYIDRTVRFGKGQVRTWVNGTMSQLNRFRPRKVGRGALGTATQTTSGLVNGRQTFVRDVTNHTIDAVRRK